MLFQKRVVCAKLDIYVYIIVFGTIWPGFKTRMCHIRGVHSNHYTIDAVLKESNFNVMFILHKWMK